MMMTPEQYAEIQAKAAPLLEKLVEVLNELNNLGGGERPIISGNRIDVPGGSVIYRPYGDIWQVEPWR